MNVGIHLPHNRRFYATLGGTLLALALVGAFVVRPVLGMLINHTNEIATIKQQIDQTNQKTAELSLLKVAYPGYESLYAPVVNSLPKTKDVAGYQTELEDLAKLTSVQLLTVDTSSAAAKAPTPAAGNAGGFPTIPVKLELSGTFASILDFINRLETMDRYSRVVQMDLKASDSVGGVRASLQIQTLYFPSAAGGAS